jgi:hypothetical protein
MPVEFQQAARDSRRRAEDSLPLTSSSLVLSLVTACAFGCANEPTLASRLVDPDSFGNDAGTLVSIADLRSVSQQMIQSLNSSETISALRAKGPLTISVGDIRQYTTITNFDKRLFVNRWTASLSSAEGASDFRFLDRDAVLEEREKQLSGEVAGTPPAPIGAGLVLSGEIREILHREAATEGGESEKRTVQYSLKITRTSDGVILWSDAREIVKQQTIGLVYR